MFSYSPFLGRDLIWLKRSHLNKYIDFNSFLGSLLSLRNAESEPWSRLTFSSSSTYNSISSRNISSNSILLTTPPSSTTAASSWRPQPRLPRPSEATGTAASASFASRPALHTHDMISVEENDKTDDELADNSQGEILHRSKHATDGDDPLRREDEKRRERDR